MAGSHQGKVSLVSRPGGGAAPPGLLHHRCCCWLRLRCSEHRRCSRNCRCFCWQCRWARHPLAVRAASFARRVGSKPGQALRSRRCPPRRWLAMSVAAYGAAVMPVAGRPTPDREYYTASDRVSCSPKGVTSPKGCHPLDRSLCHPLEPQHSRLFAASSSRKRGPAPADPRPKSPTPDRRRAPGG